MAEAASKMAGSASAALHYKDHAEAAGFVNVREETYRWPSNRWPKDKKFKELGELSTGRRLVALKRTRTNDLCKECR